MEPAAHSDREKLYNESTAGAIFDPEVTFVLG
jgi:hypothetical protein